MTEKTPEQIIAKHIMKGVEISEFIRSHRSINDAGPELVSRELAREIESRIKVEAAEIKDPVFAFLFPTLSKPFDLENEYDYLEMCTLPDIYMAEHHILICGSQLYRELIPLLEAVEEEWNRSPLYSFKISFYSLARDGMSTIRMKRARYVTEDVSDDEAD